jgi:hypothetical protein
MKAASVLVFSLIGLAGCATPETRRREQVARHYRYLEEATRQIVLDSSDGISEVEAYKIGTDRFATYGTSCGITLAPLDEGAYWRITTCVGIAGLPFEEIVIHKSDGTTTIRKPTL